MRKKLLLFIVLVLFVSVPVVGAAEKPKSKKSGITISPASQEIIVKDNKKTATGSFTVTNNSGVSETFSAVAVDMGALDDTGGLTFSGLSQDYQQKYGLARWLQLSKTQVVVKPGGKETIAFAIKDQAALSPGGHYGAVIVRRAAESAPLAERRIALSPQAASLVFLRKVGGEKYGLSLSGTTSDYSLWHMPSKVVLDFQNNGNVHLVPRGVVRIRDGLGREVAKGIINPESALVLPEVSRTFTVALNSQARVIWPGRYTIQAEYRYDGEDQFTHVSQTFYTANLRILLLLLATFLVLFFAVYMAWRRRVWRRLRLPKFRRRKHRLRR